jgi:hypothetical protein
MILIASLGRNSGKTTLAVELVRRWKDRFPVTALKVTAADHKNEACHRGKENCGVCTGFPGNFLLEEAVDSSAGKDTDLLLRAPYATRKRGAETWRSEIRNILPTGWNWKMP